MADHSGIEWTETTWNRVTGCDKVSPGCNNCYIERTMPFRIEGRHFDGAGRMGAAPSRTARHAAALAGTRLAGGRPGGYGASSPGRWPERRALLGAPGGGVSAGQEAIRTFVEANGVRGRWQQRPYPQGDQSDPRSLRMPPRRRSLEPVTSFDPAALVRVRGRRDEPGHVSQDRLGERAGVIRPQLIAYEKGRSVPGVDTFVALAEALEVDPFELLTVTPATATLADLRHARGFTKTAMRARLKVAKTTWADIEFGRRPLRPELAAKIARLLGVSQEEVFAAHKRGGGTVDPTTSRPGRRQHRRPGRTGATRGGRR